MPSVANETTVEILRDILEREGYSLNPVVRSGELGVDIVARRGGEEVVVEVVGLKANLSDRGRDFYRAFFQALARIGGGSRLVAIALPAGFEGGLRQRALARGSAWARVGETFPELRIWVVDTETRSYRRTRWNDWLQPRHTMRAP